MRFTLVQDREPLFDSCAVIPLEQIKTRRYNIMAVPPLTLVSLERKKLIPSHWEGIARGLTDLNHILYESVGLYITYEHGTLKAYERYGYVTNEEPKILWQYNDLQYHSIHIAQYDATNMYMNDDTLIKILKHYYNFEAIKVERPTQ